MGTKLVYFNFFLFFIKHFFLGTNKEEYEKSIDHAMLFLKKTRLNMLKFALSLRLFSPRIQAFEQIANEYLLSSNCSTFVDINGEVTCNIDEIDILLQNSNLMFFF